MTLPPNLPRSPTTQDRLTAFCRELGRAFRRITGRKPSTPKDKLPKPLSKPKEDNHK